ncbi:hypothetical protein SNOD_15595 [Streptomyces nodosus]|uniref:Uncharacterized protein n=1 Tax=Streptomyces nodosus TaxID=40318 RepID=A0A0B5DCJ0_9ACTN|nr:hypothetical protein SNOD_15595 [Streptomyces nodosus]
MSDAQEAGGRTVSHELADVDDTDRGRSGMGRRLSCLAAVTAVLVLGAGSLVWLFKDELFHPFGDARACEGSDTMLPKVISAGGVPIPADAADVHYVTKNGSAQVSFLSKQMPDYLHRAGLLPEGASLFDKKYSSAYGLAQDDGELPEGLCGPALKGPAWSYYRTGPGGGVDILVERSPFGFDTFRAPARVIATFDIR